MVERGVVEWYAEKHVASSTVPAMRAWRRAHPDATAAHIEAKTAHFAALKALAQAQDQAALGMMPSRMVEAVRRQEVAARAKLQANFETGECSSQPQQRRAPAEAQTLGPNAEKCVISWTGGKDCNLALLTAWRDRALDVVALVVFRPEDAEFKAHPLSLMEAQASSLGLPLVHVIIPRDTPSYKDAYVRGMRQLHEERGVTVIATGDMDLVGTMARNWIEECGEEAGLRAFLPLWQSDREANLRQLIRERFHVVFSCVKSPWFDAGWIGRRIDETTLAQMQAIAASAYADAKPLDLGGERGEYHTMCLDGPLYAHAIAPAIQPPRELLGQAGQKDGERWWTIGVAAEYE